MAGSALVTGSTKGIGHAIACVLAEEGYGLTITARTADAVTEVTAKFRAEGVDAHGVVADVSNPADVTRLLAAHRDRFAGLDVLVNNAGLMIPGDVASLDPEHWDAQVAVNLRGAFLVSKAALPLLLEQPSRRTKHLINIASIAAHYGQAFMPAYSASKAGILALTQALHGELAPHGVRVSALSPSFVATDQTAMLPIPPEEMVQPSDLGEAVRFLVRTSPACVVPEIQFLRRADRVFAP